MWAKVDVTSVWRRGQFAISLWFDGQRWLCEAVTACGTPVSANHLHGPVQALKALRGCYPAQTANAELVTVAIADWPAFAALQGVAVPESVPHKHDTGKPDITPLLSLPLSLLEPVAAARAFGIGKYGVDTWNRVSRRRYIAAALRHIAAEVMEPGSVDAESGVSHLGHACLSLMLAMEVGDE